MRRYKTGLFKVESYHPENPLLDHDIRGPFTIDEAAWGVFRAMVQRKAMWAKLFSYSEKTERWEVIEEYPTP